MITFQIFAELSDSIALSIDCYHYRHDCSFVTSHIFCERNKWVEANWTTGFKNLPKEINYQNRWVVLLISWVRLDICRDMTCSQNKPTAICLWSPPASLADRNDSPIQTDHRHLQHQCRIVCVVFQLYNNSLSRLKKRVFESNSFTFTLLSFVQCPTSPKNGISDRTNSKQWIY